MLFSASIGAIYTGDGSSVLDELGQRTVARLRLLARISTQMDYRTSYRSLPKLVPDRLQYKSGHCPIQGLITWRISARAEISSRLLKQILLKSNCRLHGEGFSPG